MRYPLYNKYGMAVDPRVLEEDYESDERVNDIPHLVELLQSVDEDTFHRVSDEVNEIITELWLYIDTKTGINLRDREKLLPIFKEYSRLSKRYDTNIPNALYRGVTLPAIYGDLLSETFGTQEGEIDISEYKAIENLLEGLAYGLRSWTNEYDYALGFTTTTRAIKDAIVFVLDSNLSKNIVLNGDALIQFIKISFRKNLTKDNFKSPFLPVDQSEYIVHLKTPKIKSVTRKLVSSKYIWVVTIK